MTSTATPRFADRRVLAVFAHPDDESLACGGTLARCADAGARVWLLCATGGSAGQGRGVGQQTLGDVRRRELAEASGALGLAEVFVLDHPDGNLRTVPPEVLTGEVLVAIRHFRPDVVITFGADGLYWHPDHIALHHQVTQAVARVDRDPPALYYVTLPHGMMRRALDAARSNPGAPADLTFWGIDVDAFGAAAPPPTIAIDVRDLASRKLAALRCHRTQIDPRSPFAWLTEAQAAEVLGLEQFHRAAVGFQGSSIFDQMRGDECGMRNRAG